MQIIIPGSSNPVTEIPTRSTNSFTNLFGTSVTISGNLPIIGALLCDVGSNTDQGRAYIFNTAVGTQVKYLF